MHAREGELRRSMMRKRIGIYLLAVLWFLVYCIGPGTAIATEDDVLESYYSGKIRFVPSLEVRYEHDSNYYSEETQEVSANSYIIQPGFEFGYATPKSEVFLDYFLNANKFSGDDRVEKGDYYGHNFAFGAQTQASPHILVGIQDDYTKSRARGSLDTLGNEVAREKYGVNSLSPFLTYVFNETWAMDFRYTNQLLDYADDVNEDSNGHRGTFDLNYHLNSTTVLVLEYNVWNRDYDKSTSTYLSNQVMMSYEKEYKFFFLKAGIGYHDRDFEAAGLEDIDDIVWNLSLYGEAAKTRYYLSLDSNFNDFGEGQQYYRGISVTTMVGYTFKEKLDLELLFDYRNRDYRNNPIKDDIWHFSAKLSYLLTKRLTLGFKWGYEERESNSLGRDYDNQFIGISADYSFDIAGK